MITFALILLICVSSPLFISYENDVIAVDVVKQLQGPSRENPLGLDELGRDLLSRIIWGGRYTLLISISALTMAFIIGTVVGTAAAYYGRVADTLIMRVIDIIMAIPPVILMITLATILSPTTTNLILVVGFGLIPAQSRMVRGQVLQVVDNEYIEAVRIQGASDFKIITSHILPNALSPIITTVILDIAYAVMVISTLSFLGLGVQAPDPEWGSMLAGGRQYLRYAWHIATFPGIALVITLMSLTLVGDGVRDALDPRMKR
jgi:peptide/nickel transport system permease protein